MTGLINALGVVLSVVAVSAQSQGCGFAPLCGTRPLFEDPPSINVPTRLELEDCCTLADTQPVQPNGCDIVNPSGDAFRIIGTKAPICTPGKCSETDECEDTLIVRPTYVFSDRETCCESCTCYGDPRCVAFDGTAKMWVLCDGREVPEPGANHDRCRITKKECEAQTDHAGNACYYLANNKNGKNWNIAKHGSPCVPNPASPPSTILMYATGDFAVFINQGERGVIIQVSVTTSSNHRYNLTAADCLRKEESAWTLEDSGELPDYFKRTEVWAGRDILWSIQDPNDLINVQIRCYGNDIGGKVYVPRINVESISDPIPLDDRLDPRGFCVTGNFDYGLSTYEKSAVLESEALCEEGFTNQERLAHFRALCQNPGLPLAGIDSCAESFCSEHWHPGHESVDSCVNITLHNAAEGFCRAVKFFPLDIQECLDNWGDFGADATVTQYLGKGVQVVGDCVPPSELPVSLTECQKGVTLQYETTPGSWVDAIAFPVSTPVCGGEVTVRRCDRPELFENRLRIIQESNAATCVVDRCSPTDGVIIELTFDTPTPSPTQSPTTSEPTASPTTSEPTASPTLSPTPFPTCAPVPDDIFFNVDFCDAVITSNNLNNEGPVGTDNPAIVYENTGTYNGEQVNLVVVNVEGDYEAGDSSQNGISEQCGFGQINVACGTTATLDFSVRNSGNQIIQVDFFDLSFVEICATEDNGETHALEVEVCSFDAEFIPLDTDLALSTSPGGCRILTGTSTCIDGVPQSPLKLNPAQVKQAAQFRFESFSSVTVTVRVTGQPAENCSKDLVFTGITNAGECFIPPDVPNQAPVSGPTPWPTPPHTWAPHTY